MKRILFFSVVLFAIAEIAKANSFIADINEESGLSGRFIFFQSNTLEDTEVQITLSGLFSAPVNYYISEYPIDESETDVATRCASSETGSTWNPKGLTDTSGCSQTTPSSDYNTLCAAGDLGIKHGKLKTQSVDKLFTDESIKLFGKDNIKGRSLVLSDITGTPLACTNIKPVTTQRKAQAVFDTILDGYAFFQQDIDAVCSDNQDFCTDTTIQLKLKKTTGVGGPNHGYAILNGPCSDPNSGVVNQVYPQSFIWPGTASQYNTCPSDATEQKYWSQCVPGYLSLKHGDITLTTDDYTEAVLTDPFVKMQDVVTNGFVVFEQGGPNRVILECKDIQEVPPSASPPNSVTAPDTSSSSRALMSSGSIFVAIVSLVFVFLN
mmetsp:Transcript_12781/g.18866  ORF Transcript_12781/g.18866 Transcript_12781/m.18866 type:complete len:379 (-) Transcript_12781:127-1263(-)|eukprot:CAMPEP_0113934862 /NCGR_PEP_ID=MMETSP1339-20121228/2115_1 /TAXON_ID=94617 /ORGANISM="Fibrocapsa japonica" /LENGTH=378 /DNA_ID=CAMNT_0000936815 /DNA_START=108 /DNA_END=1244 /DNA_ORIENTATION=- /assembly_acc=CAM_ASM_000762